MDLRTTNLDELTAKVKSSLSAITTKADLEMLKRDWLSKEGTLRLLFKQLKDVQAEAKPTFATKLNELKALLEEFIARKEGELEAQARDNILKSIFIDFSLPGLTPGLGAIHPTTKIDRKISSILRPFGFTNVAGPEVETEYYCFDALNIKPDHPARDMQDTFYTDTGHILRTHTTSVQARVLEKGGLPIKVASCGRVYRNETEDAAHQAMFHQFELIWLEEGLTLAHLMALINHILKELFGKRTKVRFVPKHYPYTEPSIGPQIDCAACKGSGCSLCGGSGWLTVAGAGMVSRPVLEEFKYDPDKVTGFAFGLGTSRLAAQMCSLRGLKTLYDGDLRVFRNLV